MTNASQGGSDLASHGEGGALAAQRAGRMEAAATDRAHGKAREKFGAVGRSLALGGFRNRFADRYMLCLQASSRGRIG